MTTISSVTTIREVRKAVRAARKNVKSIGLVPTMGALHEGHVSLVRHAASECSFVVVSIFVNPTQFRPEEDFTRYPRTPALDQALCEKGGAHLIYAPTVEEMYGSGSFAAGQAAKSCYVEVPGLCDVLEGQVRPGHFRGVASVVLKLFNQVQPDRAYFGQKDAQQLAVIRKMVRELDVAVEVIGCPTVRDEDGLALSSRNIYLNSEQRRHAPVLYRALSEAKERVQAGEKDADMLRVAMAELLDETPGCVRDYALVVNPGTFEPLTKISGEALAVIAARFGKTRLIDNMTMMG